MNVEIKLTGSDKLVKICNLQIITEIDENGVFTNLSNPHTYKFSERYYYVFEGETRLHIRGSLIEYVEFKAN